MGKSKEKQNFTTSKATSTLERENEVIALAYDEAERQIRAGTASSQIITHFLKMGSERERLEKELLIEKTRLAVAKSEEIAASERIEALYSDCIAAMKVYSGQVDDEEEVDDPVIF